MIQEEYLSKRNLVEEIQKLSNNEHNKQDFLDLLEKVEKVCVIKTTTEEYINQKTTEATYTIKFKDYKEEIKRLLKECEEREGYILQEIYDNDNRRKDIEQNNKDLGMLEILSEFQSDLKEILGYE